MTFEQFLEVMNSAYAVVFNNDLVYPYISPDKSFIEFNYATEYADMACQWVESDINKITINNDNMSIYVYTHDEVYTLEILQRVVIKN